MKALHSPQPAHLCVFLALFLTACDSGAEPDSGASSPAQSESAKGAARSAPLARNLVLITADTLRADHLQTYGYHRETAPRIDALAKESLVFEACYAPIARTTPSHLSLMTGMYPFEHGVSTNFGHLDEEEVESAAFVASEGLSTFAQSVAGEVHTAGFVSAAPVKRITGLANGFETWSEPDSDRRPGSETNAQVLPWLREQKEPFFLWVHYMDAHGPLGVGGYPPEEYEKMFQTDAGLRTFMEERKFVKKVKDNYMRNKKPAMLMNYYDGAIRILDEAVGELLDELKNSGHWDNSVIVFLSDHGEGFGQHDFGGHGDVWEEQLHVPLIIRAPGLQAGRVSQRMSTIDVLPTALGIGRMFVAEGFHGQSKGLDALGESFGNNLIFGMGSRVIEAFSLTQGDWKFIQRPDASTALYDLSKDPFELQNVQSAHAEKAEELKARLQDAISDQKAANQKYSSKGGQRGMDPKHLEELRKLGYTGDE